MGAIDQVTKITAHVMFDIWNGFPYVRIMKLERFSVIRSGSLLDRRATDALYILAGDISPNSLRLSRLAEGASPAKSSTEAALVEGDVVVALRGSNNAAAVVPRVVGFDRPLFATLDIAVIRVAGQQVDPAFLSWFINLPSTQEGFSLTRSGSAAPRLPLPALKQLEVPLPGLVRQRAIAAAAAEMRLERELTEKLQQSREWLTNELLRRAAEEGSVPGSNPTRTDHYPQSRAATLRALPTLTIGNTEMPTNSNGRKGGTTHVVPADRGGWNVKQGGAQRASAHFDTKAAAITAGRESSRARESELKIHNLDGKIAQSDSHGHDPRSVKG